MSRQRSSWTHLAWIESDSEPGARHEIKRHRDGHLGCDCLAYRFKRGEKTCKHLAAYGQAVPLASPNRRVAGEMKAVDRVTVLAETFTVRRAISFAPLEMED